MTRYLRKIIGVVILVTGLSGCIPAAIVIGATVGGAVVYDKRPSQTIVEDQRASDTAEQRIIRSPDLTGTHISVATFNHILLLVGQVETPQQRDIAYELVSNIKNVSRVYNEITVRKPTSGWQRSHDAWITTKIKTEMLAKPGLRSTQLKVVTENSVVYLMGILTHHQADMAINIARNADGVHKVVKVFEYPQ